MEVFSQDVPRCIGGTEAVAWKSIQSEGPGVRSLLLIFVYKV